MPPEFSETSYAFALMRELANWPNQPFTVAPVFPSLQNEGDLGYDVMLHRGGVPMFLQFKLSEVMVKRSAIEVQKGIIAHPPFYRMKLHSRAKSRQHELLLNLEWDGHSVFYAAPEFHTSDALNQAYLNQTIHHQSRFTTPQEIGGLLDDEPHHISFQPGVAGFVFCSEPKSKEGSVNGQGLASIIMKKFRPLKDSDLARHLDDITRRIFDDLIDDATISRRLFLEMADKLNPLQFITQLIQTYYGAQMFFVMEK